MPAPSRSVVVHGHFYQPPREDPWTGTVPRQPSAAPFHDWNQRIEHECYRPFTEARLLGADGTVARTMNLLAWTSFDFGPTLLAWLERGAPETYARILDADRASCARLGGHGNAMAAPYHHTILPLSDPRDRRTEIRWGIADFRRRFGREPEGMWLPECAADAATLAALAAAGIRFAVLAPHQVKAAPAGGLPGRFRLPTGGELAVFVYDGPLSHEVAFGELVRDGERWVRRMAEPAEPDEPGATGVPRGATRLRSVAVDGETFGHHHKFGEMGLAGMLQHLERRADTRVESFASFLAGHPPVEEVSLVEPTSWSCAHGVERWRADCGCRLDTSRPPAQAWRAPLRGALDWLAERLHERYEREAGALLTDPWAARDDFSEVVDVPDPAARARFVERRAVRRLSAGERRRALELLDMERDALRLFTSCAWFFDDVGRIEPRQVLTYAAHAIELAGDPDGALERGFAARLPDRRQGAEGQPGADEVFVEIVSDRPAARTT